MLSRDGMTKFRDQLLAVVNGLVGDYLVHSQNALAITADFFIDGAPLPRSRAAFAARDPQPSSRVVVLVHGLMGTERNWQPPRHRSAARGVSADTVSNATTEPASDAAPANSAAADITNELAVPDFGARLAVDHGFEPFYVRYNSGQAIPDSGVQLAALLQQLSECYPVAITELLLVGHSMGGLVIRAACHQAAMQQAPWLRLPMRAVYIGTPHRGAPFERIGRVTTNLLRAINDPVTRLLASIAGLRSAGIQDLGDADVRHEDRARRQPQLSLRDPRHPVPLLATMQHLLIAGAISDKAWLTALFGDSIVPLASARNDGGIDPHNVVTIEGIAHVQMLHDPRVYTALSKWLIAAPLSTTQHDLSTESTEST